MGLGKKLAQYLTRDNFKEEAPKTPPSDEQAWSEDSRLYSHLSWEKYNPDDLIGTKGYGIYNKMMQDDQVKAAVNFKRGAITSRDWFFELDTEELSDAEIELRVGLCERIIEKMEGSFTDKLFGILSGMYNGFSMTEKLYDFIEYEGKSWVGVRNLKLKPFDTFFFYPDAYGNLERTVQKIGAQEIEVDQPRFIHFVQNPEIDDHYGGSELRAAYRHWWSKDNVIKFRNMWLERHASGFTTIKPSKEGGVQIKPGTQLYTTLQNILSNMSGSTGIILPSGLEMDQANPNNNVAFREAIEDYDLAIARALLVPNLMGVTPSGQTGSYSQSDTQLEAFFWTLEQDTRRLEDTLNEQLWRDLAQYNFGDDAWPKFRFKPMTKSQMYKLVKTWQDLVSSGAVKHSDTDESHLRELLGFPEIGEVDAPAVQPPPGQFPPSDQAGDEQQENGEQEGAPGAGSGDSSDEDMAKDADEKNVEETVIGRGLVSVTSFSRATKRVDFAVIDRGSEDIADEHTDAMAGVMDRIVGDLVAKAKEGGGLKQDVSENVRGLKVDGKLKRKLNAATQAMLRDGFKMGEQHAKTEVDKAKGESFSRRFDMKRLDLIADDYFKARGFKITGNLTDEAVNLVGDIILTGARYDKTWVEVEDDIYSTFAAKGLISAEQAKDALGEALGVDDPSHRLRTITRTSTFDAINTARYGYFTDPGLGDFVQAFEYSAILDSRTTEICRHLDEADAGNHSRRWWDSHPEYNPPNHYNCRSVLVPVTIDDLDEFSEGPEPSVKPQEGFK